MKYHLLFLGNLHFVSKTKIWLLSVQIFFISKENSIILYMNKTCDNVTWICMIRVEWRDNWLLTALLSSNCSRHWQAVERRGRFSVMLIPLQTMARRVCTTDWQVSVSCKIFLYRYFLYLFVSFKSLTINLTGLKLLYFEFIKSKF